MTKMLLLYCICKDYNLTTLGPNSLILQLLNNNRQATGNWQKTLFDRVFSSYYLA